MLGLIGFRRVHFGFFLGSIREPPNSYLHSFQRFLGFAHEIGASDETELVDEASAVGAED